MRQIFGKGSTSIASLSGAALVLLLTPGVGKATHIGIGAYTDTPGSEQPLFAKQLIVVLAHQLTIRSLILLNSEKIFIQSMTTNIL